MQRRYRRKAATNRVLLLPFSLDRFFFGQIRRQSKSDQTTILDMLRLVVFRHGSERFGMLRNKWQVAMRQDHQDVR
jgi:hypothetical protein